MAETTKTSSNRLYLFFAIGAGILFSVTAAIAIQGLPGWEQRLFEYINGWDAPGVVTVIARIASDLVWAVVFLVAFLLLIRRFFHAAWRLAVPGVAAYGTVFILEHIITRARPEFLLPVDTVLRASQDGMGFPSGHMATITAVVLTLWPQLPWQLRIVGIVLLIAVGWSRIYLGVHFPLDIVSGFAAGLGVVCVIRLLPVTWRKKLMLA